MINPPQQKVPVVLIAERILASYAVLQEQYTAMLAALLEEECDWVQVHGFVQQSTACTQRIADIAIDQVETEQLQQCEQAAQICLQLHQRICAALDMRKKNAGKDAAHVQKVAKALDAYRPNAQQSARFQDRHL